MAAPLQVIVPKLLKSGKTVYKRGHWRVSESAYRSQQWRLKGGKAGTATRQAKLNTFGEWMRRKSGPPGGSMTWAQIAKKYPDKMADYIDEFQQEFR